MIWEHLRELLNVASGGVVFTTIQKFFPDEKGGKHPTIEGRDPRRLSPMAGFAPDIYTVPLSHSSQIAPAWRSGFLQAVALESFHGCSRSSERQFPAAGTVQALQSAAAAPVRFHSKLGAVREVVEEK